MKDKNGDLLAHSHNISNRRKNYFGQLINSQEFNNVRQTKYTSEPLVHGPSSFEVKLRIEKLIV
jgi:hypothetical protein